MALPVDIITATRARPPARPPAARSGSAPSRDTGIRRHRPVAANGGFGVNMQAANQRIDFAGTWNPGKEDQATNRAYRIGQTCDVSVYYPTVAADDFQTFDVKLDKLLGRKRSLAGDMLDGTGEISARELDIDELRPAG